MITNFNTPTGGSPSTGSGKVSNTLVYVVVAAGLLYLGYKYVYVPFMEKKKLEQAK